MAGRCYGDTFEEKVVQTFDLETRETPVGFVLQYSNLSSKLIKVNPYHLGMRNMPFPVRAVFRYKYSGLLLQKD